MFNIAKASAVFKDDKIMGFREEEVTSKVYTKVLKIL